MEFKLTLTQRHVDALCASYGYEVKVNNEKGEEIDNPISPEDFVISCIKNYIDGTVKAYEINIAVMDARLAKIAAQKDEISVESDILSADAAVLP